MSPPRKRRSSQTLAKNGHAALGKCEGELEKEKKRHPSGFWKGKGHIRVCGFMWADNFWIKINLELMLRGSDSGSRGVGFGPKTGESMVDEYL